MADRTGRSRGDLSVGCRAGLWWLLARAAMLTPAFELTQDCDFLTVAIRVPHARASEFDVYFEGVDFKFYAKPYFLRRVPAAGVPLLFRGPRSRFTTRSRTHTRGSLRCCLGGGSFQARSLPAAGSPPVASVDPSTKLGATHPVSVLSPSFLILPAPSFDSRPLVSASCPSQVPLASDYSV